MTLSNTNMAAHFRTGVLFILLSTLYTTTQGQALDIFRDSNKSENERIDDLLSKLTIEEKIGMLGSDFSIPRLKINGGKNIEGIHGVVLGGPSWNPERKHDAFETTVFPQGYGLGETWDKELLSRVGAYISYEARYIYQNPSIAKGGLTIWTPNADLGRDIRWGRTEECYGEDANLTSQLVTSFVRGIQGNNPKYWRAASLMKHFLANSNEEGRTFSSSNFDERLWHEYYAYPFYKGVIAGGANAIMAAYNSYNGTPCAVNSMLQQEVLKSWGLNGIIMTDGGAFRMLMTDHKAFPNLEEAAAAAIKAGISKFLDNYKAAVQGALEKGLINEKDIDKVLRGNIRIAIKLGLLDTASDNPYSSIGLGGEPEPWSSASTKALVREVTAKSVVLLKNQGILPINRQKVKKIAVIGPRANKVLLDWYCGTPRYKVSPLDGIRNVAGSEIEVLFAESNKLDSAVKIAREADIAIVCIGNHPTANAGWAQAPVASDGKEAVDRASISLEQEDLVKLVRKANPKTIEVLISSFPYAICWSQQNVPAIVHLTHCSQELGNGLADVLFGNVNPAGRTTQTWLQSIEDLPDMMDYNIRNGRTYMYFKGKPLYPFGHGLSYTTFTYSSLQSKIDTSNGNKVLSVSFSIKNSGGVDGDEVPQVYIRYTKSVVERPLKELKGFERVFIKHGETRHISIQIPLSDIAYWNASKAKFEVENGTIEIEVGASSSDIRLKKQQYLSEPN